MHCTVIVARHNGRSRRVFEGRILHCGRTVRCCWNIFSPEIVQIAPLANARQTTPKEAHITSLLQVPQYFPNPRHKHEDAQECAVLLRFLFMCCSNNNVPHSFGSQHPWLVVQRART